MKSIFNLSFAFTLNILLILLRERQRVYVIVFLIFFPLIIKVFSRDALSVPTLSIYLFATLSLLTATAGDRLSAILKTKSILAVFFLIVVAVISTAQVPFGELTGPSVRKLSDFISSTLLFLFIVSLHHDSQEDRSQFIEKLLSIVLISIALQILIAIFLMKFPQFGSVMNYFTFSHEETLEMTMTKEITRIRSLILTPESFGEIIAVATPFVLYKMFTRSFLGWLAVYLLFGIGEILTVTRSGMVLYGVGTILFLGLNVHRLKAVRLTFVVTMVPVAAVLLIARNPDFIGNAMLRFNDAFAIYQKTGDIAATINRAGVWDLKGYLLDNLSWFGHGLIPPFKYGEIRYHFHNLWFTLTFQFGIVGVTLFAFFFLSLYLGLIRNYLASRPEIRLLSVVAIIALTLFLVNEVKYEFNRREGYQQLCWTFFAIFSLIAAGYRKRETQS